MEKSYSLDQQHIKLFLYLLRCGLGTNNPLDHISLSAQDLEDVLSLSARHKLAVVVYDGICRLDEVNTFSEQGQEDLFEDVKYKFVGYQAIQIHKFDRYLQTLNSLLSFYRHIGVRVVLLKGYGLAQYWPIPSHRSMGDIDVYLMGHQHEADRLLHEKTGISVNYFPIGHHTEFLYRDAIVENHTSFVTLLCGGKRRKSLEIYLEKELTRCVVSSKDEGLQYVFPNANFNAVYLIVHMSGHFRTGTITLCQLCDWVMFVKAERNNIQWDEVSGCYRQYGFDAFVDVINEICIRYLGLDSSWVPPTKYRENVVKRVFQEIIESAGPNDGREIENRVINRVIRDISNGWKYRLLKESLFNEMIRKGFHYILHPKDFKSHELFVNGTSASDK